MSVVSDNLEDTRVPASDFKFGETLITLYDNLISDFDTVTSFPYLLCHSPDVACRCDIINLLGVVFRLVVRLISPTYDPGIPDTIKRYEMVMIYLRTS